MYNLGKWLAEGVDLGIQISPNLSILRCLSANDGVTLRKVGGVVVLHLKLRDGHPSSGSIAHLHPDLNSGEKPTVSYFDGYIAYSGLIGIYSYKTQTLPKPKERKTTAPLGGTTPRVV
jgi:hypothetical protein